MVEMQFLQEQKNVLGTAPYNHMDVGNAGFAWSKNLLFGLNIYAPCHDHHGWWKCNFCRSKKLPLAPRHTTHMDVGNAGFAWSKNLLFVLNIYAPCHPWHRAILFVLNIKKVRIADLFYELG
jgi:hypothetical protein